MKNEIINEMQTRLCLLNCRLNALEKERSILLKEKELLEPLVKHYDTMEYDSIEEERRVTQQIAATKVSKEERPYRQGVSKYFEPLKAVFENSDEEWRTNAAITEELNKRIVEPIGQQQVFNLLKAQIKTGKVIKHGFFYKWNKTESKGE